MTQKEIKKLQKELDNHWKYFNDILSERAMTVLSALVDLELQLEAECGQ
jgi:hypothetical protein